MENPVVIIGSGLAGYMFAKEYRQLNKERPLMIITASDGRFYSKPLLSTALTHKKSVEALAVSDAETMSNNLSAKIITGATVIAIDARKKIVIYKSSEGEKQLHYGDLILACGAEKLSVALEGNAASDVHSVNTIEDYEQFREWIANKQHIGILGAGFVGCEFANDLINTDHQVTVIAPERHPLARLVPEPIGKMLVGALAEKGVHWVLGHCAKRIDRINTKSTIILDNDMSIEVDGVMSAVGIKPALDLAKSAGIKTQVGIVVDAQLRSSDPHIYALGDCAEVNGEVRQYVAPIMQCARILAKVLMGEPVFLKYPVMPIVIKTPACPIVTVPPPKLCEGEWYYEGEGDHLKAIFKDTQGHLQGFVLVGNKVRERVQLVQEMV